MSLAISENMVVSMWHWSSNWKFVMYELLKLIRYKKLLIPAELYGAQTLQVKDYLFYSSLLLINSQ